MQVVKQILKVPESRELKIKLPKKIAKNEIIEVLIIYKDKYKGFQEKLEIIRDLNEDKLFQEDLEEIADNFSETDKEGWEQ